MIRVLILIAFCVVFSSCGMMIARLTGSYKTPRIESHDKIRSYCADAEVDADAIYVLKEDTCLERLVEIFGRLPSVLVFNSDSGLVFKEDMQDCSWKTFSEVIHTGFEGYHSLEAVENQFQDILECTTEINIAQPIPSPNNHLVLAWAKYLPAQTRGGFELARKVRQEHGNTFKIHFINFDTMEEWNH